MNPKILWEQKSPQDGEGVECVLVGHLPYIGLWLGYRHWKYRPQY
jgi:hypothetical protein